MSFPRNLTLFHTGEEKLRVKALELLADNQKMKIHLSAVENAMNLADILRQEKLEDDDYNVIKLLNMRIFNAFAASIKLCLSGYSQNGALIMRDIVETVFLLDLFRTDYPAVKRWRLASEKERKNEFSPIKVRLYLDKRDGFEGEKRHELYKMFCELAGHANIKSTEMLRPNKGMDARSGPFIEQTSLFATISEMGRLAVQSGDLTTVFIKSDTGIAISAQKEFNRVKALWFREFY